MSQAEIEVGTEVAEVEEPVATGMDVERLLALAIEKDGAIEVIDAIEAWGCGFHAGNVIKYVARHKHKNGLEDVKKAAWYLNREIGRMENGERS